MKKLTLKLNFCLTDDERKFMAGLPANTHDAKLSSGDARQVGNIFYRVFGTHTKSNDIVALAMKNKWPGNERKTTLQAQRDILQMLVDLRTIMADESTDALELMLNTMVVGNPLQVAVAGVSLHLVAGIQRTPDMVDVIINGRPVGIVYMTAITNEYATKLAKMQPGAKVSVSFRDVAGKRDTPPVEALEGAEYVVAEPALVVSVTNSTPGNE